MKFQVNNKHIEFLDKCFDNIQIGLNSHNFFFIFLLVCKAVDQLSPPPSSSVICLKYQTNQKRNAKVSLLNIWLVPIFTWTRGQINLLFTRVLADSSIESYFWFVI